MDQKKFDYGMHNFRALAIACIVFCHCATVFRNWDEIVNISDADKYVCFKIFYSLFGSSTIFFVFISGYLSMKLFKGCGYIYFIQKKIKNVISPYLVMSIFFIIYGYVLAKITGETFGKEYSPVGVIKMLLLGEAQPPYWYIPFIFICFLFTPFIININRELLLKITLASLTLPVIFPRSYFPPESNHFVLLFTYFVPGYLLGFVAESYKEEFLKFIRKIQYLLVTCTVIAIISYFFIENIYYQYYQKYIVLYISHLCLCLLIYMHLSSCSMCTKYIDMLSKNSFTIYFIHWLIINLIFYPLFNSLTWFGTNIFFCIINFIISSMICLAVCLILSIAMRKVLKTYARQIIG